MARKHKADVPRPELNITAMMDLVLNLVAFFVMVSNFATASLPIIQPPKPDASLAKHEDAVDRVTVSVVPNEEGGSEARDVQIGMTKVPAGDVGAITALLLKEAKISDKVAVDLRADRNLRYDQVQPVLVALGSAGIKKFNIVMVPAGQE